MGRVLVTVGCVLAGALYRLTGSLHTGQVTWSLLLPIGSVACIALLWE